MGIQLKRFVMDIQLIALICHQTGLSQNFNQNRFIMDIQIKRLARDLQSKRFIMDIQINRLVTSLQLISEILHSACLSWSLNQKDHSFQNSMLSFSLTSYQGLDFA